MAVTEVREEADLLRLRLHIARAERDAGGGGAGALQLHSAPTPRLCAQACRFPSALGRILSCLDTLAPGWQGIHCQIAPT